LALILEIFKKIKFSDSQIRKGKFRDLNFERRELFGKTLGVIGVGKVGSYVVRLAKAFGMKIIANDIDSKVRKTYKNLEFRSSVYLLKHSDIVSIHIPLNDKNKNFISKSKFDLMKKNSVFINTSRGAVIDEKYLIRLLKRKKIKFAGLDVFENEPDINRELFKIENLIMTNHTAGKTAESRVKMSEDIFHQISNHYIFK